MSPPGHLPFGELWPRD